MLSYLKSSIFKKFVMGLTGLGLAAFVFVHMAGNLLIFVSAEAYNTYGHKIVSNPLYPLISWGLVAMMLAHAFMGILLSAENNKGKSSRYAVAPAASKDSSVASKTMIFSGSILLVFIITHLVGFKYGNYYEVTYDGVVMRDLFRLILEVFQNPVAVVWYIVALIVLCVHLRHGVASCFQSLGFNHPRYTPWVQKIGILYAVVVAFGFISQPLYVYLIHKG
jgi:succinate dehydrogenase / fumarate reductase cytochrome b subunit